jgi:superfamily II DNA or RNA helicase
MSQMNYLGNKGYTIHKSDLTKEQLEQLKKQLTVKPSTQGQNYGPSSTQLTYPIYRESSKKIYIPRYFGEEQYGSPKSSKLPEGDSIDIPFKGELREIQKPIVETYMNIIGKTPEIGGGGLLDLPCAMGKTVIALNIISQIKKKTLIIVHKEFLLNQWIERITEFLPTARVGRIQGPIIDIHHKDIVICMLQSLSMKEYDDSVFESFGLTIVDEVHHISSEVFSCALFKLVTKYTLGLSATMNRKDGTSYVFKMFLGDILYKGIRDEKFNVVVRAIEYITSDEEFNEIETDFRGQVKYSTMISKLCAFTPRTEFILRVLCDMIQENGDQQIMILAHNKNILEYMYNMILERNIATVGYYIGGMKEQALKLSESKQVIIATYSMAAEALDIKTLTTLIMATPKTDIEQAVGRILRQKHGSPIVVDIIDSHQPFKNQWIKRRCFYKKQNYKIITTNTKKYTTNIGKWMTVYVPFKDKSEEMDEDGGLPVRKCLIDGIFEDEPPMIE